MSHARFSTLLLAAAAGVFSMSAQAEPVSPGVEAIRALGRLNGTALACEQMALVGRSRQFMVQQVPKTRQNGEYFEEATHEAYLDFTRQGLTCPGATELAARIDQAGAALAGQFPGK